MAELLPLPAETVASAPLVSVGVPTFNRAATIERALVSVLAQDYPNIEVVVSDNASSDATEAVCRRLARGDPRVRYLRQTANRGPTENFMEVLRQARGEYFMWLGDDDWLPGHSYISTCTAFLISHPDHALACGVARYFRDGACAGEGNTIDLPQESPADRVAAYYAAVRDNGTFYGVMRREQLLRVEMKPLLANDWLLTGGIAFQGKVKTLGGIAVNRDDNTPERTFARLAMDNALHPLRARWPYLSISLSVLREIAIACPVYATLTRSGRVALGLRCLAIVVRQHAWPGMREKLRRTARRALPPPVRAALRSFLRRLRTSLPNGRGR